jgi:hypothetical protein
MWLWWGKVGAALEGHLSSMVQFLVIVRARRWTSWMASRIASTMTEGPEASETLLQVVVLPVKACSSFPPGRPMAWASSLSSPFKT